MTTKNLMQVPVVKPVPPHLSEQSANFTSEGAPIPEMVKARAATLGPKGKKKKH